MESTKIENVRFPYKKWSFATKDFFFKNSVSV